MTANCELFPNVSKYISNFPSFADVIILKGMYPVKINSCNGMESTPFSNAFISCKFEEGVPLAFFTDLNQLADFLGSTRTDSDEGFGSALKKLEMYLSECKKHEECILSLKRDNGTECAFQVTLAEHLFGPLSGNDKLQIGNNGLIEEKRCRHCDGKCLDVGDTLFGSSHVWHGYADIYVNRSIVKISDDTDVSEDELDESYESSEELSCDETLMKKRKRANSLENGNHSDDSSAGSAMSQALAQTIVNAFCVRNENIHFSDSFIPSFLTTNNKLRICSYNCEQDVLLVSCELNIFSGHSFNFFTIFLVWYFLNFKIGTVKTQFTESNFKTIVGDEALKTYQTKVSRPMTNEENTSKPVLHMKKIDDPVMIKLYTTVTTALGKLRKLPCERKEQEIK